MRSKRVAGQRRRRNPQKYLGYGLFELIDESTGEVIEKGITLDQGDLKKLPEVFVELLGAPGMTANEMLLDYRPEVVKGMKNYILRLYDRETNQLLYSLKEAPGTNSEEHRRYGFIKGRKVMRRRKLSLFRKQ